MSQFIRSFQLKRRSPVYVEPALELSTDQVTLRPLGYADESVFIESLERSRSDLRRWIPLESKNQSTCDLFQDLVQRTIQGDQKQTSFRRAIFLNDSTFAGMVNLIKIKRGLEWTAEVNWWIDSAHTGKGIGTMALQILIDHALADMPMGLGLHKVRAMICLDNHASVCMAERLGFSSSGQSDLLRINDALVNHHEFTVTV